MSCTVLGSCLVKSIPTFARNREVSQQEPYTNALKAVRKHIRSLEGEELERFFCLVADVARILAWGAGRRSWDDLINISTRHDGEEFGPAIRRMGVSESLATSLWLVMRDTPNDNIRFALSLVFVRLQLCIAWIHTRVLEQRDHAGRIIDEAFRVAELDPSHVAELSAEDFVFDDWKLGGEIFDKVKDTVFSRNMDTDTVLTEDNAFNDTLRQVFGLDDMLAEGRGHSPSHDTALRNAKEIGVKGALCEMEKLFGEEAAARALENKGIKPDDWILVSQPEMMQEAAKVWAEDYERRLCSMVGADIAAELLRRCQSCFAFGRAMTPAFILLTMLAQKRWDVLAGDSSQTRNKAIEVMLERGGSWPNIMPPEGVSVRSCYQTSEPTEKEVETRNRWTGRDMKWYVVLVMAGVMVYGWYAQIDGNTSFVDHIFR